MSSCVYALDSPTRYIDPSGLERQPAAATNPAGCLAALLAAGLISESTLLLITAGLLLQVGSITIFGVTLAFGTPVSLAAFAAGLMLEGIAVGAEAGAFYVVMACIDRRNRLSASGVMAVGGFVGFATLFVGMAWNVASFVRWRRGSLAAGRLLFLGIAILTGTPPPAVLPPSTLSPPCPARPLFVGGLGCCCSRLKSV